MFFFVAQLGVLRFRSGRKVDEDRDEDEERVVEEADEAQQDALRYLRLALKYADKETSVDELNTVRYLLCYLLYTEGNYQDAAVIGDFIALVRQMVAAPLLLATCRHCTVSRVVPIICASVS